MILRKRLGDSFLVHSKAQHDKTSRSYLAKALEAVKDYGYFRLLCVANILQIIAKWCPDPVYNRGERLGASFLAVSFSLFLIFIFIFSDPHLSNPISFLFVSLLIGLWQQLPQPDDCLVRNSASLVAVDNHETYVKEWEPRNHDNSRDGIYIKYTV